MFVTNIKNFKSIIFCVILMLIGDLSGYRILGIIPDALGSHFKIFEKIFLELNRRGHNVTVISHYSRHTPLVNYHEVSLEGTTQIFSSTVPMNIVATHKLAEITAILGFAFYAKEHCGSGFKSKQLQEFARRKEKYDIVIADFVGTNCLLGLMSHTGGSLIILATSTILPQANDFAGNPDNPAYVSALRAGFSEKMSFLERTLNVVIYVIQKLTYKFIIDIPSNKLIKKLVDPDLPDLSEFFYNVSLILTNVYHTLHGPRPYVPAVIDIGGIHIGEKKGLPQHLEKWINESTDGVIFFSMGSMIKGHTFPEEKREMFVRAFARLKQRVLWKWENETLPNKPDNVMIQKWMPQFDILSHPNVKAFITHGGLLSTTEAVHCGVPAVVMPQFGDQFTNARALESSGGGIILHFSTITEEDVYNALKTVLDPSFNKQAKELSVRFKDRPMPPLETAIYWIEYVARHKGAPHLRSAAVGMPYYQYLLLDVIAFLLLVILVASYISFIVTRFIFRKLFKKQVKVKKQ